MIQSLHDPANNDWNRTDLLLNTLKRIIYRIKYNLNGLLLHVKLLKNKNIFKIKRI